MGVVGVLFVAFADDVYAVKDVNDKFFRRNREDGRLIEVEKPNSMSSWNSMKQ